MRLTLIITFIFMFLFSIYSCRKEKDTTATIKIINKTGFIVDTLEVFSSVGNPYSYKYYNLNNDEETMEETILNPDYLVYFMLNYDNKSFLSICNPLGLIDARAKLKSGKYLFYLIPPDSLNNNNSVAFTYRSK
ncbi:MAG TPA: hypothetical protein VFF35_04165 [Bacteroidia bacterium]|nr:hypothetical protein [Bacteroidia bacterium]